MLNLNVARGAFHLVFRDVLTVDELGFPESRHVAGGVVAVPALLAGHFPVALDDVGVTVLARDTLVQIGLMLEDAGRQPDFLLRGTVT
ncbi:MAG: hypothetical protein HND57_05380 [Planctomycetes bacterium]|nr:hypothetical protein [Planctomycetota bacterium]